MRFFTSDTHFWHSWLVKEKHRPFPDVRNMNETLVANWNRVVAPTDEVWHLGDVSFGNMASTLPLIGRLNGFKRLVLGNHDKGVMRWSKAGFITVDKQAKIVIAGQDFLLSHFPYEEGASEWHPEMFIPDTPLPLICGHVHHLWRRRGRMFNVGVDVNGWTPVSEFEVAKEFGLTV